MKTIKNLFKITLLLAVIFAAKSVKAQGNVSALIKSGPEDATKLAQAYLNPLFKGFGVALNSGWNFTAKSKNLGRFEIRIMGTPALVPDEDKMFDVTSLGLSSNIRPSDASQTLAPTVSGKKTQGPEMTIYDDQNNEIDHFQLPKGADLFAIPAAQLQATVGLPRGIDVTLRGMPQINLGDKAGKVNMIGGGVKFELLPLITGKTVSKIIPLDLALAVGYTQLNYKLGLNVPVPSGAQPESPGEVKDFSNQHVDAKISAINTELILSKKLTVFTPFISIGYNTSKTNAGLKGNYPMVTDAAVVAGNTIQKYYTTFTDPVNIKKTDISNFRSNIGFQLNLAFFRFFAAYSMSEYNAVSAGIGFGIGK